MATKKPRKGWENLSPAYRKRLERGGISAADYASGKSLSKARGHSKTPEHPTDKIDRKRFRDYYDKRQQLMRDFIEKKDRLWGQYQNVLRKNGSTRYNPKRSADNVRDGKMSNQQLQWALEADEDELIDALSADPENFAFIGYH